MAHGCIDHPPYAISHKPSAISPSLSLFISDYLLSTSRRAPQNDAALRRADELDEVLDFGACQRSIVLDLLERARRVQLRLDQVAERALQLRDHVLREAAPHQTDRVHAVHARRAAPDRPRDRQRVLRHHRVAADERVPADAAELVHARARADVDVVLDRHVPAERRHVAEDRVVTHVAVVRDVHVRHEHVAIANRRHAAAALRAAMDRDELAEDVALADRQPRLLAAELEVLWGLADRRDRIDLAVVADLGPALDDARRADAAVPADADVRSDDGVRADDGALPDPGAGIDDGGRID